MRRAYTLIELLAVTIIIVIVIGAAIPAFTSMSRSSNASLADSTLKIAVTGARDAAIQSVDGGDAAAVFFYEPGGKISIGVYREAGTHIDVQGRSHAVFAPDPTFEPLRLPKNYHVCGLAPVGAIGADDTTDYAWYSTQRYDGSAVSWVFPETGFFDDTVADEGRKRQTFMVRFKSATGEISLDSGDALIYAPSEEPDYRGDPPFDTDINSDGSPDLRPDRSTDLRRLCRMILLDPNITQAEREELLGDMSSDSVLARPVREVALYDVRQLSAEMREMGISGFRGIDSRTGCLYTGASVGPTTSPVFPNGAEASRAVPEVADIFIADRYSGSMNRLVQVEEEEP